MSTPRAALHELGSRGVRRLLLTAIPLLIALILPLFLGAVLPDHAYLAPSWAEAAAGFFVAAAALFMIPLIFIQARRWGPAQQPLMVLSWAFAGLFLTCNLASAFSMPPWGYVIAGATGPMCGLAAWLVAGHDPDVQATIQHKPKPGEPMFYADSAWVPTLSGAAAGMFSIGVTLSVVSGAWHVVLFFGLGLVYLSLARLQTRIDHRGVTLTLPWLGGHGRLLRYQEIITAELAPRPQNLHFPTTALGGMSGHASKTEPTLVLHLTNGEEISVTVNHPCYAANLVNQELHRMRTTPGDNRAHY